MYELAFFKLKKIDLSSFFQKFSGKYDGIVSLLLQPILAVSRSELLAESTSFVF